MKKTVFFLLYLFCVNALYAQDIAPGEQAQGYLKSKNVMVDYATGIFHYSVPLFELKSGDYTLPVSLNYTGRGVKYDDRPGMVGYNWTLQTGGVLTRTLRGGIADEKRGYGMANGYDDNLPLFEDIRHVNTHERDGESDVFTAIFNGKSVQFILLNSGPNEFKIEPLEKTNVKIEYTFDKGHFVEWRLTDENGITYVYAQPEWTVSLAKQECVGPNSVKDESYISSWYLSKIDIPNRDVINFYYDTRFGKPGENSEDEKNKMDYVTLYNWKYHYGSAIKEYCFEFAKYSSDFNRCISEAEVYIAREQLAIRCRDTYTKTLSAVNPYTLSEKYFIDKKAYRMNERILGILSDFPNIYSASQELIASLNTLMDNCSSDLGRAWLGSAKSVVKTCLTEVRYVQKKESTTSMAYEIYSPLLTKITNNLSLIEFKYAHKYKSSYYSLDSLIEYNGLLQRVKSVALKQNGSGDLLQQIVWDDSKEQAYQSQKFTYYYENEYNCIKDKWGNYTPNLSYSGTYDAPGLYAKKYSLSSIENSYGGKIFLDYVSNTYSKESQRPDILYKYFGIRIKNIIFSNQNETKDTINYYYPYGGKTIYKNIPSELYFTYQNFTDTVICLNLEGQGNYLLGQGNNGLFYPYVEEEIVGKGKNCYLFSVPIQLISSGICTPYWLGGHLLGKAVYNRYGNLVTLEKNTYYADLLPQETKEYLHRVYFLNTFYFTPPSAYCYTKTLNQVKADPFYADPETLDTYYSSQKDMLLYLDKGQNEYLKPYEMYKINIKPRTGLIRPGLKYDIRYGGKVVLKSKRKYIFTDSVSSSSTVEHLLNLMPPTSSCLTSFVEYNYENSENHINPTKVIERGLKEDRVYASYNVIDLVGTNDPVVKEMYNHNVVAPIIKKQLFRKKEGEKDYKLYEETIHLYDSKDSGSIFLPLRILRYVPENGEKIVLTPAQSMNSICSFDKNKYRKEKEFTYCYTRQKYLEAAIYTPKDSLQIYYDQEINRPILKGAEGCRQNCDAVDSYRKHQLETVADFDANSYRNLISAINRIQIIASDFKKVKPERYSAGFQNFYRQYSFHFVMTFVTMVADHKPLSEISPMFESMQYHLDIFYKNSFRMEMVDVFPAQLQSDMLVIIGNFINGVKDVPKLYELQDLGINTSIAGTNLPRSLTVKPVNGHQIFKVYYYVHSINDSQFTPSCRIVMDSQTSSLQMPTFTLKAGEWKLISIEIDVSNFQRVKQITADLPLPSIETVLSVIVPRNIDFEAISTDVFGNIFCKLNQNGQVERYEYDAAGRLIKTFDQDGNLLQENHYHLFTN